MAFIVAWSGMRGGISLAAALAVPVLPALANGTNPRDLLLFLVFCVIIATLLLQGLTLPWLLKVLDIPKYARDEKYNAHLAELNARLKMIKAGLRWLKEFKPRVRDNKKLYDAVKLYISEYQMLKKNLKESIGQHGNIANHDEEAEIKDETFLLVQLIEIEKAELLRLWHAEKINMATRNKLLAQLDHRANNLY